MINCTQNGSSLTVALNNVVLVSHSRTKPFITLYKGKESVDMYRGNFFISDDLSDTCLLPDYEMSEVISGGTIEYCIRFSSGKDRNAVFAVHFSEQNGRMVICFDPLPKGYNRLQLSIAADNREHVYGCGEQFSYFDLRGHHFPLWTQEQGVGRNKQELLTRLMDQKDRSGGDYYTTFYPQPTYVSTRDYYLHAETYGYADFDFSSSDCFRLLFWTVPSAITVGAGQTLLETVQDLSVLLGRQQELPSWIYDGMILGIQGGTDICLSKLETMQNAGCPVCGIWAQDWEGRKITSFGKRLKWNWVYDKTMYPELPQTVQKLAERQVRFLGYINPYVLEKESLYTEAAEKGYLVLNAGGKPYLVDFGEFYAGIIDFTNSDARNWYTDVICNNLIKTGFGGWMADFGEYLPTDVVLHDGSDPMQAHNAWPGYWAQINEAAVVRAGKQNDCFFFMRAGNARSLKSCSMMWAGDQNVDWSEDDGLPSALTSALSLAMCGMGLHHSDIGGYTTVRPYLKRSKELLLRWAEFAAFTILMRTHEGNIPEDNWQFDGDDETIRLFTRMASIHKMLKPYIQNAVHVNHTAGIPVICPLFLKYPSEQFYDCRDEYLFGSDMLAAPVLHAGETGRKVILPEGNWIQLFTGEKYTGGCYYVGAPSGFPPVFYMEDSEFADLFKQIQTLYGRK